MVIERSARVAALRARFADEAAGPPNGTEVGMRCSYCGRFLSWVHPPLPSVPVRCSACPAPDGGGVVSVEGRLR